MQLLPLIEEEWKKVDLIPFQTSRDAMAATVDLVKPRARNLKDFATLFRAYFSDSFEVDPAAVQKFLKDDTVREMLVELASRYEQETEFSEASTEKVLREFAAAEEREGRRADQCSASRAHRTGCRSELIRRDGEPGTGADSSAAEESDHPIASPWSFFPGLKRRAKSEERPISPPSPGTAPESSAADSRRYGRKPGIAIRPSPDSCRPRHWLALSTRR